MHGHTCSLLGVLTVTITLAAVLLYDKGKHMRERKVPYDLQLHTVGFKRVFKIVYLCKLLN